MVDIVFIICISVGMVLALSLLGARTMAHTRTNQIQRMSKSRMLSFGSSDAMRTLFCHKQKRNANCFVAA